MRPMTLAVFGLLAASMATQAADSTLASQGAWDLTKAERSPANGTACILTPKEPSRIQVGKDALTVTGLPKNSIFNYQYRIDDGSASVPTLPTAEMQNAGVITFEGDAFRDILKGRRLRIRILDRWHEAITEDIVLDGLRALHGTIEEACR